MQLRKNIKTRGHFPSDEAATKLLWLAIRNVLGKTLRTTFDWRSIMAQRVVQPPRPQKGGQVRRFRCVITRSRIQGDPGENPAFN
jgi:putative transposase